MLAPDPPPDAGEGSAADPQLPGSRPLTLTPFLTWPSFLTLSGFLIARLPISDSPCTHGLG